jgi:hypothetical protein
VYELSQKRHDLDTLTPSNREDDKASRLEMEMTLKEFQIATSAVPAPALRCAMAAALSVEPARTPDAYSRFYTRVVALLGVATEESVRTTEDRHLNVA